MRGWSHVSLWLSSPAVFVVVTRCISKCVQPATVWSTWPSEIWWECHTQRPRSRQSLRRWVWVFEQRNGAVLNGPDLVICRMKLLSSWQQVVTVLTIKSSCVVFRWRLWTVLMRVERCSPVQGSCRTTSQSPTPTLSPPGSPTTEPCLQISATSLMPGKTEKTEILQLCLKATKPS